MNGFRILQIAGGVLAVIMLVLLFKGTNSSSQYLTWAVLCFVGMAGFAVGRWLDERSRQ